MHLGGPIDNQLVEGQPSLNISNEMKNENEDEMLLFSFTNLPD